MMFRERYLPMPFLILLLMIPVGIALQTAAGQGPPDALRTTSEEVVARVEGELPKTAIQQVLEAVSDDSVVIQSEDGRTVLMMEGELGDEFSMSFSDVVGGVAANIKLGKGGLGRRFTLVKPSGSNDVPIYLDLVGPAVNGGAGIKITIRF